jgi:hypothetical protein
MRQLARLRALPNFIPQARRCNANLGGSRVLKMDEKASPVA